MTIMGISVVSADELLLSLMFPEKTDPTCQLEDLDDVINGAKKRAVNQGQQHEAELLWQAQTVALIQREFMSAFMLLKSRNYYEAWNTFERCEVKTAALLRHYCVPSGDPHRIQYINEMTAKWQELYPYKAFFSPEFLKKKVVCSICNAPVTPRRNCGHKKWGVYDGEMCYHIVVETQVLSISIVDKPVQKYSVAFLVDEESGNTRDHYNYSNIQFLIDRLASPFHGWKADHTTRTLTKADLDQISSAASCPCASGKRFGNCCIGKELVIVPHLQFYMEVAPPDHLPTFEVISDNEAAGGNSD